MEKPFCKAIIIGCSAGSGETIDFLLRSIPKDFLFPLIIVRHIGQEPRNETYYQLLSERFGLPIKEPEDKEKMKMGTVYFSPPGYHLLLENEGTFALDTHEKEAYSRPSIDVFLSSAARALGPSLVAILLSGANRDGAEGMGEVADEGGVTIALDPEGHPFGTMAQAAIENGKIRFVYNINEILEFIIEVNENNRSFF